MTCGDLASRIPLGCRRIDDYLGGGIRSRTLSLVYGEAETGKSTLALQCTVNCARRNLKTLFVDCDGSFSPKRLVQIAPNDFKEIVKLIILMRPNDFREQATIVDRLADCLTKDFGLVVFDTVTSLYRTKISEYPTKAFDLNRELNRQMAVLAQIARIYEVAILMTSQVHTTFQTDSISVEPVATRVLKFWADVTINMQPTDKRPMINLSIERKKEQPSKFTCIMQILKTGICEPS